MRLALTIGLSTVWVIITICLVIAGLAVIGWQIVTGKE